MPDAGHSKHMLLMCLNKDFAESDIHCNRFVELRSFIFCYNAKLVVVPWFKAMLCVDQAQLLRTSRIQRPHLTILIEMKFKYEGAQNLSSHFSSLQM